MSGPAARRLCAVAAWGLWAAGALGVDFPVLTPPASMFRAHREKLLAKLPPGSVAILRAAPVKIFSNDTEYAFRQDSDFHYVTGFDEPDAVAVLRPGAADGKRYILYVQAHDPRREAYEGTRPGPEGAMAKYGADAAFPVGEFFGSLSRYEPATRGFRRPALGRRDPVRLRWGRRRLGGKASRGDRAHARPRLGSWDDRRSARDSP